jgi:NAD(P)-dependent dehydrogenase (short-subunit alcohol dehydrogenase family)
MSNKERAKQNPLSPSGRERRRFLEQTLLAGAVTSATLVPSGARGVARAASAASCPDLKTPMQKVEGKVAFITGGASGIGLGIAKAFADAGMKVVLANRTDKHLDEAMKVLESARDRVHSIQVDVTDRPGMEQAAAEAVKVFGKVHVLVNNAGIVFLPTVGRTTYEEWDGLMGVNLTGVFNGIHTFLPRIQAHGEGGHIISTSSILGLWAHRGGNVGAYSASKFAVVGLMEALHAELADTTIGASVFCPGPVRSNITKANREAPGLMEALEAGRLVLRGMRNNDLYILTHPEAQYEQLLRERYEALVASLPKDVRPTEASEELARSSFNNVIYRAERDRKRCIQVRGRL